MFISPALQRLSEFKHKQNSFYSQLSHLFWYKFEKSKNMNLGKGMLIISIDIDVGNSELGLINGGKNDTNVNDVFSEYQIGKIEEKVMPVFINLLDSYRILGTFAIRGQLTEVCSSSREFLQYSKFAHEIGSHGFYHKAFSTLSLEEAETELNLMSSAMKQWNIPPKSFIFPKNQIAYLKLLPLYGYTCYRGLGGFSRDCMYIENIGKLHNVHPSLYVDKYTNPFFLKKILNLAISKKLPFHLWFHLWNFGNTEKSATKTIQKILRPFFDYAQKKEEVGLLSFETMNSATMKIQAQSNTTKI